VNPLLLAGAAVGLYLLFAGEGKAGAECVDEGIPPEAANQLLLLLNEPHTRAELDAAVLLLAGFPKAQECCRKKRGSDE
jgi:hypothetical protein